MRKYLSAVLLCAGACAFVAASQSQDKQPQATTPEKIDFVRDVQPIFKARCIGCHGPKEQKNGFRLDRRKDAMLGGTIPVIGPGNAEGSRLYNRLIGDHYGIQMPPTGALPPEQIAIIKAWIDQGAAWPDSASGEALPPPLDSHAVQMMEALRNGATAEFQKLLAQNHDHLNGRGPGSSTPLMYAALYGSAADVRDLLTAGADPNLANESGATALMWATDSLEKVRLLIDHGADVNAKSDAVRTPLLIAAGRHGAAPVVKLLLDHGANPSAHSPSLGGDMTPLAEAAYSGDYEVLQMLIARGADMKAGRPGALAFANLMNRSDFTALLSKGATAEDYSLQLLFTTPPNADAHDMVALLEHGADPNFKAPDGNSLLHLAAATDVVQAAAVKTLLDRGLDANAKNPDGKTPLDYALLRGDTPVVELLRHAGATSAVPLALPAAQPAPSNRAAVERSIPLLQRTDVTFAQKSGCISCHNNTLTAQSVTAARASGIPINETIVEQQRKFSAAFIESWRDRVLQNVGIPGDADTMSYILLALSDEKLPPDPATDAMVRFMKNHQAPDGSFTILAHRPPIESSNIEVTATSMRAMQLYGVGPQRAEYQHSEKMAGAWIAAAPVRFNEDRVYKLLGLHWAGASQAQIQSAAKDLLSKQNSDGGWSQIPTIASDAYATGQALVALLESGSVKTSDAIFTRGAEFLRSTQLADGSWFVRSRAIPLQPYFESGFPHGHDQFISAAGTNWATRALAMAAGASTAKTQSSAGTR